MTRRRLLQSPLLVSILGVVVLAGCTSGNSTSLTTTTVVKKPANPRAVPDDLRRTIFDRLPHTYIEEPVGSVRDGPLGLAATANATDDRETATQKSILKQYGFRSAYQRTWIVKGTAEMLIIRVEVMGSSKQALGYFNLLTFADRSSAQLTTFATPLLAETSGFTRSFVASTGKEVSQDINMVRGDLFYHLIFTGPEGSISPGEVLTVAKDQSIEAASLGYM
jgi:hypothetical protein